MTVINLAHCRDFLQEWEEVKRRYISGKLRGAAVCLKDDQEQEGVSLFGSYREDPDGALKAAMRIAIELNRLDAPPGRQAKRL